MAASTQAVEVYRRLAATDPAAFEPDLARALAHLGADLSDVGRLPDALAATRQAVNIRRGLTAAHPVRSNPTSPADCGFSRGYAPLGGWSYRRL